MGVCAPCSGTEVGVGGRWTSSQLSKEGRSSEGLAAGTCGCLSSLVPSRRGGGSLGSQRELRVCWRTERTSCDFCISPFQNVSDSAPVLIYFSLEYNYTVCNFQGGKNPLDLKTKIRMEGKHFEGAYGLVIDIVSSTMKFVF